MQNIHDHLLEIFFDRFSRDTSKYIIPRVPFFVDEQNKRIMDYAVISKKPGGEKVAILLHSGKTENSIQEQKNIEESVSALQEQKWIPVILSKYDILYRPRFVEYQLEDVFSPNNNDDKTLCERKTSKAILGKFLQNAHGRIKSNADVILVLMSVSFIFCICLFNALSSKAIAKVPQTPVIFAATTLNGLDHKEVAMTQNDSKEQGDSLFINLDRDPFNPQELPAIKTNGTDSRKTLYLATVRYCVSGTSCILENGTNIELWGVKLPEDSTKQQEANIALNEMIAGQYVTFQLQKSLGSKTIVKATLANQDVAMVQVQKGLLLPNEEGDIYQQQIGLTQKSKY